MLNLLESSPALAAAIAIGLVLAFQINLHYKLLGGSFIEGHTNRFYFFYEISRLQLHIIHFRTCTANLENCAGLDGCALALAAPGWPNSVAHDR